MKAVWETIKLVLKKYFLSRKGFCYLCLLFWFNAFMFRVLFGTSNFALYVLWSLEVGMFITLGLISFEKIKIPEIIEKLK